MNIVCVYNKFFFNLELVTSKGRMIEGELKLVVQSLFCWVESLHTTHNAVETHTHKQVTLMMRECKNKSKFKIKLLKNVQIMDTNHGSLETFNKDVDVDVDIDTYLQMQICICRYRYIRVDVDIYIYVYVDIGLDSDCII